MEQGSGAPAAPKKEEAVTAAEPTAPVEPAPIVNSTPVVEDVPDPDEDDLDDLDDMLDEFSTVKLDSKQAPKSAPAAAAPAAAAQANEPKSTTVEAQPETEDAFSEDEFAKQLQAGMADLLGELEKSPEMQEQFEHMFKQMAAAAEQTAPEAEPSATPSASASAKTRPDNSADASFQDTIRRTMERMQTSGDQATAAAASDNTDDFMTEMLKQLSSGNLNADGSEEDFSKMLMGMMEQLTNKEILYEPMKELDDKFPGWFERNKAQTPPDDLKRYEEQRVLVREIVSRFEQSTYSDSNAVDREYIVDRMQKMQAAGSPPEDLVGDLASAQEAFAGAEDQCNPQ